MLSLAVNMRRQTRRVHSRAFIYLAALSSLLVLIAIYQFSCIPRAQLTEISVQDVADLTLSQVTEDKQLAKLLASQSELQTNESLFEQVPEPIK